MVSEPRRRLAERNWPIGHSAPNGPDSSGKSGSSSR
jgi:hypothetical protein